MNTQAKDFSSTNRTISIGLTIIVIVFGFAGGWAAMAPLSQGAVATGKVVVENQRKSVQHFEGGIVKNILVEEGSAVKSGDVLIELDNTLTKANAHAIGKQYYYARAEEARLNAEIDGDSIQFPDDLKDLPKVYEIDLIKENQMALFEARQQALTGELEILEQKSVQLKQMVAGLASQKLAKTKQTKLLHEEIKDNELLYQKKSISKIRLLELKRMSANLEGEIGGLISEIAGTELQVGETKLQMLQLKKEFREKSLREMREIQKRLADTRDQFSSAESILSRTIIRAPVSGIVVNNKIVTLGEIINSGETLMEIVPQDQKLIIEAKVQTQDIDTVSPGMEAEVRFLPFKQRLIPIVIGKITGLSADILEDERTGENYYLAKVEISAVEMKKLGDHTLVPGMPADVIVNAGEHTMLQYLLAPLSDNFARAFKE